MKPLRVLVAEDNLINQKVIVRLLKRLGCIVSAVSNGAEAVDFVKNEPCDLVLMDLQMPVMDGLQASHLIRHELGANITIVAMTAGAIQESAQKFLESGIAHHLTKPIGLADLEALLDQTSNSQHLTDCPQTLLK